MESKFLPRTVLRSFLHKLERNLMQSLGTLKKLILMAVFHAVSNFETNWELKSQILIPLNIIQFQNNI